MKKAARRLSLQAIGILLSLMLLLFFWMLFTASGSRTSLNILQNRVNKLEYEYKSGTLASGLHLERVKWQLKNNTVISSPSLTFHWNPKCWHAKELCITELSAAQLVIDVAPGGQKSDVKTLTAIDLPVSIIADSLKIGEVIINNVSESPFIFTNVDFGGRLEGSALIASRLKLDWLWLQANINGTMTLTGDYPIAADATLISTDPGLSLPISSNWQLGGDLLSLQLEADFTAPYQASLAGTYSMLRSGLPADIKISWATAPWPRLDSEPQLFVDKGELYITGTGPDYKTKATAVIHGHNIPNADIALDGKINSRKATFFPMEFQTLGGSLAAEGVFKWHNGLSWNTNLTAHELWPDLYWPQLKGLVNGKAHFSGRNHNGQTRLALNSINATGTLHDHQFRLTGDATKDPFGVWHLSAMEAVNQNNQIYANGTIGVDSDLKLLFNTQSIHKFISGVYGDLHGDLSIRGNLKKPNITGAVSSANLKIGDVRLRNVKSQGVLIHAGHQQSKITTVAESIVANSQHFHTAKVDLNGRITDHHIQIAFDHKLGKAKQIRIKGGLNHSNDWQGQVTDARGLLADYPIALKQPFNTYWIHEKRSLALEPHCWKMDLAEGCVANKAMVGKNGKVFFTVNSLELSNLSSLQSTPLTITGLLNSQGELNWGNNRSPSVALSGDITNAVASVIDADNHEKVSLALDTAKLNIATTENLVKTQLSVKAKRFGAVNVLFDVDTASTDYPVNGSIAISNSDTSWLRAYLPDTTTLEGQISADGVIGGNLEAPQINGVISLHQGAVSSPSLPVDLEDIALDIEFDNKRSRIHGSARSGDTPIRITGTSSLGADSQGMDSQNAGSRSTGSRSKGTKNRGTWSSLIHVKADNLKLDTDLFRRAIVSPNLNIHLADTGIRIDGDLNVHRANIVVNDIATGGIATSRDVVIVDASDNEKQSLTATRQNFASELDVSLGRNVRFNGYGLKADLSGDFHLALDAHRPPELLGEIMVDNGTYRSYGQNLIIRDGRITFVGPLEQTAVTVEAVREVDNILAGLRVDGSLQNPTTTLFSEPTLPEEEILSYVVLGRSLEFGSTDDSQMLTNAALFMGISNGRNFSQNIAKNLGIEDFYLTATGTGDETQVMLSGRLNNRLLVRYGVGVFNAVSTLFLRYDLAEQLYIETTQGLEKAIDIFYSFEF